MDTNLEMETADYREPFHSKSLGGLTMHSTLRAFDLSKATQMFVSGESFQTIKQ